MLSLLWLLLFRVDPSLRPTAIEIEEFIKSTGSLTKIAGQNRDLLHDKQFLEEEVINKLDNMLEYMEKFSKDITTLLEGNQTLRSIVGIQLLSLLLLQLLLTSQLSLSIISL